MATSRWGIRCAVAAAAAGLLTMSGVAQNGTPAFSRSRWIAEQAGHARFEGGVERGLHTRDGETARAPLAGTKRRHPPPGPAIMRVSNDILDPDEHSGAQPETEAEVHLVADPDDERHLVAGYQEDRFEDGGARALTFAVSTDGGKSWEEGLLPNLTEVTGGAWERASDPWLAWGTEGRSYYATIAFQESRPDNAVTLSSSDDGGHSWSPPSIVHVNHNTDFDDKEAVIADTALDSPFQGRVYVAWDTVIANQRQVLRIAHSRDGGATWSAPVDVWSRGFNVGALPLTGPGGVLYLVWMSFIPSAAPTGPLYSAIEIRAARSDDGGDTWSEPALVALADTHGVPGMRTGELPAAAIDRRSGRLYVAWQDQRFTPGTDQIVMSVSDDGGYWTDPRRISDGPDDAPAFTPAVAVNGQGHWGVAYATFRNDPARRFLADQYLVTTNNRGRVLGASRVSNQSFDIRDAAVARGYFLGDYQGLVAGASAFRPVWVATSAASRLRDGNQPDVVALYLR